jgi:UDP-N-acetylmuramate dehydrogenase
MNAGAFQGEIMDVVAAVPVLSAAGEFRVRSREEMNFSYRRLVLDAGEVILAGEFRLRAGGGPAVRAKGEEIIRRRLNKHPYDLPNAGSVFKNPPEGPAGKWIEETGMKGVRVGDAEVSVKHANFIVNRGAAKAGDILALMALVQQRVWREKGVRLEPEIRIWGEEP